MTPVRPVFYRVSIAAGILNQARTLLTRHRKLFSWEAVFKTRLYRLRRERNGFQTPASGRGGLCGSANYLSSAGTPASGLCDQLRFVRSSRNEETLLRQQLLSAIFGIRVTPRTRRLPIQFEGRSLRDSTGNWS